MCFDFVPAQGAILDGFHWVVLNQYSDTCYVSNDETFCFESCFRGPYEIAAIATYDNFQYTCVSYRQFDPVCAPNTCKPWSPPDEIPGFGLVYLEARCGGSLFAFKTVCTCVDYQYDIYYAQPKDLTIPCSGNDTINKHKTFGPCACDTITVALKDVIDHYEILVHATLPSSCCNTAVDKCKRYLPKLGSPDITICGNCSCESPGCTVRRWIAVDKECQPDLMVKDKEDELQKITPNPSLVMDSEILKSPDIIGVEIFDLNGKILHFEKYNPNQSVKSYQRIKDWLNTRTESGLYILRLIYKDGTTKVKKVAVRPF